MTDREKLIGLIDQVCKYSPVDFMHPYGAEIIADHLIANGVTVQEWIPVKEKLPENETIVLCWRGKRWCEPEICTYGDLKGEECFYYIDDCGFPIKCLRPSVTHWIPLPELPKEK